MCGLRNRGDISHLDWLDKLTFKEVDRIGAQSQCSGNRGNQKMELVIQLPRFMHDVLYQSSPLNQPNLGSHKEDLQRGNEVLRLLIKLDCALPWIVAFLSISGH